MTTTLPKNAVRFLPIKAAWLWLTLPMAGLVALASAYGAFDPQTYAAATPSLAAQGIGQDFVNLFLMVPILLISGWWAVQGSQRGLIVWLGVVFYVLYSYIIYAFATPFNALFLIYTSTLACALYATLFCLWQVDAAAIAAQMAGKRVVSAVAAMLLLIAVLFAVLWLSEIIPAIIAGITPASVIDTGTPSNMVQVLDLAILLPGLALIAYGLWRRNPLSYVLAPAMLGYGLYIAVAIMGMVVVMVQGGHNIDLALLGVFGTISLICLGLLVWYLRALSPTKED